MRPSTVVGILGVPGCSGSMLGGRGRDPWRSPSAKVLRKTRPERRESVSAPTARRTPDVGAPSRHGCPSEHGPPPLSPWSATSASWTTPPVGSAGWRGIAGLVVARIRVCAWRVPDAVGTGGPHGSGGPTLFLGGGPEVHNLSLAEGGCVPELQRWVSVTGPVAFRSKRSRLITLLQTFTKSCTNFRLASSAAYTSAMARS